MPKTTRAVREVSHYLPPKNGPPKSVDCFLNSLQGEGVLKDPYIKLVGFSSAIQAFQFSNMFGPQLCFNSFCCGPFVPIFNTFWVPKLLVISKHRIYLCFLVKCYAFPDIFGTSECLG